MDDDPRTYAIIGAAMRVHSELGPGFLEVTYQDALALEFELLGLPFERELSIGIHYRGRRMGGNYRADFRCHREVIVELKALPFIGRAEVSQLSHYLSATGSEIGLLLNFGSTSLQFQRVLPRRRRLLAVASQSAELPRGSQAEQEWSAAPKRR